jgi:flavin-dependent dehydrogenase
LGFSIEQLMADGMATRKRGVEGRVRDGPRMVGRPHPWMARRPLRFELSTVHLDRSRFDTALFQAAVDAGVEFVPEAVRQVVMDGDLVSRLITASGGVFCGDWFIDASGRARVLARAVGVGRRYFSEKRLALWSYRQADPGIEGTVLRFGSEGTELFWVWEIPVAFDRLSVGLVAPASESRGSHGEEVFRSGVTSLGGAAVSDWEQVRSRGYRGFVSDRVSGANWLLVGEAACFVDPLSSIGVTSAMRHGFEAAGVILEEPSRKAAKAAARYQKRTRGLAVLYNEGIEGLLIEPRVRRAFGWRWAARAYVTMGFSTTSLYGRIPSSSRAGTMALLGIFGMFRLWVRAWTAAARLISALSPGDHSAAITS